MSNCVQICYAHGMFCEDSSTWVTPQVAVPITDLFDDASFTESTCPMCSSGEPPKHTGLAGIQAREYVGVICNEH